MHFLVKPHRTIVIALSLGLISAACTPLGVFVPSPTPTPTLPPTGTFTASPTDTLTPTITPTSTDTLTATITLTPSSTSTSSLTATFTTTPTLTLVPSPTPTPIPPRVNVVQLSSCRYGPGPGYLYKYGLVPGNRADVIGRMQILARDTNGVWGLSTWLKIQSFGESPDDTVLSRCWVNAKLVAVERGNINDVPDYSAKPKAPELYGVSTLYGPVTNVSAERDGNFVDVYWQATYMTEDDYRGYMIEAWVCYQGHYDFAPVAFVGSFEQNEGEPIDVMSIPDEPGCSQASYGQIFLAEKHGYSNGVVIPWPALPTSTASRQPPSPNP